MPLPHIQQPPDWQHASVNVIRHLVEQLDPQTIRAIAVDGTSGTVMLCDDDGAPCSAALMYNDQSCHAEAEQVARVAPEHSAARGASASLARVLYLLGTAPTARHVCHQADWIAGLLCGRFDFSDENNCLKTGYDPVRREWPLWLSELGVDRALLPQVYVPGRVINHADTPLARELGLPRHCQVVAGTTDSIAAFIATGADSVGDAVTSLGSTLVLKMVSDKPVSASRLGVYSHRLGDTWLAGGASNSGGKVLLKYFDQAQLDRMTPQLDPGRPTGLAYYPLPGPGERFPHNDPAMQPRLEPRPDDDLAFFQAMLEGIADIEAEGYRALSGLGAPPLRKVITAGGGAANPAWRRIREQKLGVPVGIAEHSEASYGAALLAKRGITEPSQ